MRKLLFLIVCLPLFLLTSCDVHEWPETPELVKFHLRLKYETDITNWDYAYDGNSSIEQGLGKIYDNQQTSGKIRYIIRAYPILESKSAPQNFTQEFSYTRDISDSYDHEVTLELPDGSYDIMVWSDLIESGGDNYFYNVDNFSEIELQGDHKGNTNYRDAFRGVGNITLDADIVETQPDTLDIAMQRPLAKFEFIATDVVEFIAKEATRIELSSGITSSSDDISTRVINIEDYRIVFYYVGYMPDTYNMHTDKPVDSVMNVMFESSLKSLSETQASMGFDYVFVNGVESVVMVQIGLYGKDETQLSLTEPIKVPLKRSRHTVMKGSFLIQEASGGIAINPDFDGEHNVVIP